MRKTGLNISWRSFRKEVGNPKNRRSKESDMRRPEKGSNEENAGEKSKGGGYIQ